MTDCVTHNHGGKFIKNPMDRPSGKVHKLSTRRIFVAFESEKSKVSRHNALLRRTKKKAT